MDPVTSPNNRDKIFKGQQSNEEFLYFFRHHWIDLFKEILFFGIFILVTGLILMQMETIKEILQGNREMKLLFFTVFLSATVYIHRFFLKMFNYFFKVVIITDSRIIDHYKTLFFTDNQDSIDLAQIQNIEKVQEGVLPSLFKYGDIKVFLNASDTIKTFHNVPNAKFHFRALSRAKEDRQNLMMGGRKVEKLENPVPNSVSNPATHPIPFEEKQELNTFR